MNRRLLDTLLKARAAKRPCVLITNLKNGSQSIVFMDKHEGDLSLGDTLTAVAREALVNDRSGPLEGGDGGLFVHVFNPPLKMAIVGAVHVAQPLSAMAAMAGFEVTVIDPRRAFATEERFPGVNLTTAWPDEALQELAPDHRTAVVTLTHDPKLDDPALGVALNSRAFYIGSLGSTRTHAKRLERLKEEGFDDAARGRIHGPVGLALGAKSAAEIAVSILAQVVQVHRQGGGRARPAA
jgi:xanthine dehydrogenase accessory factor